MVSRPIRAIATIAAAACVALNLVAPTTALGSGSPDQPPEDPPHSTVGRPDRHVTLITGDRITLAGGDLSRASITPGPGRRNLTFSTRRVDDRLYVVPSDVSSEVASGRLDRRLFEVAGLIRAGYDDAASPVIPLLVTYSGKATALSLPTGVTITRRLTAVDGAAMTVVKKKAAGFVSGLAAARSSSGIAKVWLDGKRRVHLDQSVRQIGAPAAWQAGHTGKGVPVAVLDSGVDATHPDLADRIKGAHNFTAEPAGDQVGHGTHVASIVAGNGAGSGGRYRGVAPDAALYDGKVCTVDGCPESAILAGMDWAATKVGAKVVVMSLGGIDGPELDPVEAALNHLTARTGTLFVVAAGNSGPTAGTVESPGSAAAALTVGAVDRQDRTAEFSSRGPRLGDLGLKPDVTAPGVGIVAARSKDGVIGEAVGDKHVELSGTSMATPHVAAAAAILAEQHPDWKATELKGALMASAQPVPGQSGFAQGAGRIDLARAIGQTIVTEEGGLSFGKAEWPHADDAPLSRTLTYRNAGDRPVALTLRTTLTGPGEAPAPENALQLSATTLTVPARGTASVQVTSDTRHDGSDGLYSGRVTATAGAMTVVSPVGLEKEVESYTLAAESIGPDGAAANAEYALWGLSEPRFDSYGGDGDTVKVRLPKADYLMDSGISQHGRKGDRYLMVLPLIRLDKDVTVTFDARAARRVTTTVPRPDATRIIISAGYDHQPEGRTGLNSTLVAHGAAELYTVQLGPKAPAAGLAGLVASRWGVQRPDGSFSNTPYQYGLVNRLPGEFPTGFTRTVRDAELAQVEQVAHATGDRRAQWAVDASVPGTDMIFSPVVTYDLPARIRLYLEAEAVSWRTYLAEVIPSTDPENPHPVVVGQVESALQRYQAGHKYRERWNAVAFVPTPGKAERVGSDLLIGVYSATDADGHGGLAPFDSAGGKLYRNGELLAENAEFGHVEVSGVPGDRAAYKYVTTGTRLSSNDRPTRTDLTWTFRSAGGEREQFSVRTVQYVPDVDQRNVVRRASMTALPVRLAALPGATLPAVRKLEIDVSGDDGRTWQRASVVPVGRGAYKAFFSTPPGDTVSLRARIADAAGNTTDQTTIAAYRLR